MLYRGSSLTKEVKWVIFDEIHYMRDKDRVIQMCHSRNYTPLIIFAFSKKECEKNATEMLKIDLTDDSEKEIIKELYENAIRILADDDRALPQVQFILPLLLRGIGIHHGGLLPIIKEIIEIMFQESLLKVLFSTETFSMGINMPAKTVVFTSLRKFDGVEKRLITSGEYIQMAGRAGRRGLDDRGIVIIMLDSVLNSQQAEELFVGEANRLLSQFHLGYNMILNLLRIEGITPKFMIERSFYQYQGPMTFSVYQCDIHVNKHFFFIYIYIYFFYIVTIHYNKKKNK
uniref:Helicase C-terminal domain-containing protein n=1 Tax=Piliocolobus tephrosceles TaxID=591936 RepID=A0A8C9GU74_9PRIM